MLWLILLLLFGSGVAIGICMSPLNIAIVFLQQTAPIFALITMQIGFAFLQNLLLTIPVAGGFACLLSVARTGGFSFNDFLIGFRKFVPCVTYSILLWLISALPFAIIVNLANDLGVTPTGRLGIRATDEMIIVFGILIVISYLWYFFSSVRLGWGLFIIVDRNVSSSEAFRISWDISRGNVLTLFATSLVLMVIFVFIAIVTLLIGAILLAPYYHAFFTVCYLLMSGQNFQGKKTAIQLTEE
ncbi:MAG: glycerophosphoryl diester phosphodiesterase membrane domain-containing protein [Planctomycetaceae bacterium]|nr:glycerophosphoryl diester phosphodiesterase membrane domain-containing protein [Planctomycetaceae bacterium]